MIKILAVVIVHIGGIITPNIFKIKKFVKFVLIEDAAKLMVQNIKIFCGGDAGAISFFTTKVMTTGEGGDHYNSKKRYENVLLKTIWIYEKLLHDKISGNYKLSEFSALLGTIEPKD